MMGLAAWFSQRGFSPFPFQHAVWQAMDEGRSGLLHASTGAGKTLAVWGGVLQRARACENGSTRVPSGLRALWITPMRALAAEDRKSVV